MKRFLWRLAALASVVGITGQAIAQPTYVYTTIDVPGSTNSQAAGINNSGQIVGGYFAGGRNHGFLLSGGVYTTLDVPGSAGTTALGINDSGQIVGFYDSHGFLLSGGQYTMLDVPDSVGTQAFGINNSGQIVGVSIIGGTARGFLLSGRLYSTVAPPGSSENGALGINTSGKIVGTYRDSSGTPHGFVFSGGSYATLGLLAHGINDLDRIVGENTLLSGRIPTRLNVPGSTLTAASGINNAGQIVGSYFDAMGIQHAFLATPVPPVTTFAWQGPFPVFTGVTGNPSLVQAIPGTYGMKGNYELVVPLQSGGLAHFYRNNDDPSLPWNGPFIFATDQGSVDAVSLIQSNFSSTGNGPGNLAVVARIGSDLVYYYRDDVAFAWHGPSLITTGVTGVPSFVQARSGTFGTKGNYELVAPLENGGVAHFYRNNDDPNLPWTQTDTFATEFGIVDAVSLIQSNFSTQFAQTGVQGPGNLAVVARVSDTLYYLYRDDVAPFAWHGPTMTIATGATGNSSFVQAIPGSYGSKGNYEMVVALLGGGLAHFYRNNDDSNLPWTMTATFGTSLGTVGGLSLIQSNFSTAGNGPGNLAVVSVANNQLDYFYRDDE